MEKKMKLYNEHLFPPIITLMVTSLAGILSMDSPYWLLPVIGGSLAAVGVVSEKRWALDFGLLGGLFSFYLLNRAMDPNILNLSITIIMFFVFFSTWVLDTKAMTILRIKKDMVGEDNLESIREVEKSGMIYLMMIDISGLGLAYTASILSLSISIGPLVPDGLLVPLIVFFGLSALFILYAIMKILPKF